MKFMKSDQKVLEEFCVQVLIHQVLVDTYHVAGPPRP